MAPAETRLSCKLNARSVAQRGLTDAIKVIDTLPSPEGEGGARPALSPAGGGRAYAHRRSLTLQSFSDGAAPARRRVRGLSPKNLVKRTRFYGIAMQTVPLGGICGFSLI